MRNFSKILVFGFLLIIFSSFVLAEDLWYFDTQYLVLDLNVNSGFELTQKSPDYSITSVTSYLNFNPQETDRIELIRKSTVPNSEQVNSSIKFYWVSPELGNYDFKLDSRIKTFDKQVEIKTKVKFPIESIPNNVLEYMQSTDMIDINPDIFSLANEQASGQDDLYDVAFKLGLWVNQNIKYDLSSVTASVTQKSSWVLENRKGVCDELTSLYISMMRSIGVPARYVAGIAYTNSDLFTEKWGPHGWAEVYFPGYGWVPFDTTYGELGHIDPSHIDLQKSVSSNNPSTSFEWKARDVQLTPSKIDYSVSVIEAGPKATDGVTINSEMFRETVGFGSYNYVKTQIANTKDYYVPVGLMISRSENIENFDEPIRYYLLKPKEKKTVFWKLKVNDELDSGFYYTFKILISTLKNQTNLLTFEAKPNGVVFDLKDIDSMIKGQIIILNNSASDATLVCISQKSNLYVNESMLLRCKLANIGNTYLKSISVCYKSCSNIDLGIGQSKELNYSISFTKTGQEKVIVTASNSELSKTSVSDFLILDAPKITIKNLDYPNQVNYSSDYEIQFVVVKDSISNPVNVKVNFLAGTLSKDWSIEEMSSNQKFDLNLKGKDLKFETNKFNIEIAYEDSTGKTFTESKEFDVKLTNMPWYVKLNGAIYETFGQYSNILIYVGTPILFFLIVFVIVSIAGKFKKKE